MRTGLIIAGTLAAGLAAAFLGGAVWGHNADIDSARYLISNDVVTATGAVFGALFLALAGRLLYGGLRPR